MVWWFFGGILFLLDVRILEMFVYATLIFFFFFVFWMMIWFKLFHYPKKILFSLRPFVNYDTLEETLNFLWKHFPEEKVIVKIYKEYKTKKIIDEILKFTKSFTFLGKEYLVFPSKKKIEFEFSVKKWEIYFPERKLSICFKQKVRIVSEQTRTRSRRSLRDQSKCFVKNDVILKKLSQKTKIRIGKDKKKILRRIPDYYLTEPKGTSETNRYLKELAKILK